MIKIDSEQECLLELLKNSLFDLNSVIPEGVDWDKIFDYANKQCIVPLVASYVPVECENKWKKLSSQNKARFLQLTNGQNSLVSLLNNNNVPYVILKGTAAGIYYPVPYLRSYGDIDFFVSEKNFDFARDLLEQNGYQYIMNNDRHYEFRKFGIDYELHSKFSCDQYNDIDHIILNGLNNSVEYMIYGNPFSGLPVYENGLVLLGHIMRHLKTYGIGFRQIIDWMMFVNKELDDFAWENHFRKLAVEAGLEKLAITVTYMCKKWIGLPKEISWCNNAEEEVADQLLARIFYDGNFGHYRASYENVKIDIKNQGLINYLHRAGIENWPLAQKYAVLRPFAFFYQIFRYVCIGIAGLFTGKNVFKKNKRIIKLEELWKSLE